jgi:hypothetical protein
MFDYHTSHASRRENERNAAIPTKTDCAAMLSPHSISMLRQSSSPSLADKPREAEAPLDRRRKTKSRSLVFNLKIQKRIERQAGTSSPVT